MQTLILTLHISVCVLLVILVLLQSGKEGMGVIFGGGNSSVFGSSGAGGILAKLTALMAVIFVITSLSYTIVTSDRPESESAILSVKIEDSGKGDASAASKSATDGAGPAAPATTNQDTAQNPAESASPGSAAPAASEKGAAPDSPTPDSPANANTVPGGSKGTGEKN